MIARCKCIKNVDVEIGEEKKNQGWAFLEIVPSWGAAVLRPYMGLHVALGSAG